MNKEAFFVTIEELARRGAKDIPEEAMTTNHLVYSSPATLSYNSPGAQGFGVKRAGLAIPESVELVVSPGCCGRNSTIEGGAAGFSSKIFFLRMDETDLVTGRHLTKISDAVHEIVDFYKPRPKVVVLCVTCADALLGTDMERVCRRAEAENIGIRVIPTYMYALTRESIKPPMEAVRRSIYSLLERGKTAANCEAQSVNLMGFFAPLDDLCELYPLLKQLGFDNVNEISRCRSFEEYLSLGNAKLNIVLHPEANLAAEDLRQRLGTGYIELKRLYQADKIHRQYELFAAALGKTIADSEFYETARNRVHKFKEKFSDATFSFGQTLNGEPFEMALAFARYGFKIDAIFANLTESSYAYIRQLALVSPETKLYLPASPTMLNFKAGSVNSDFSVGRDISYDLPNSANVAWNSERQPFGYEGLIKLLDELDAAAERSKHNERTV